MAKNTPTLEAKKQVLREAYAALNRNDVPGFVKDFAAQIERVEPAEFPGGGTYHGIEAVKAHVAHHRGNWAEGSCEPQRFIVAGDKIIVITQVRVRLKQESQWREGSTADVFTFRDGKIIQFYTFFDEQQALQWAGAKA